METDMSTIETIKVLAEILRSRNWQMAAAESCTGGLVCAALTELAGSSDWFERGFIAYSNEAKSAYLGIPAKLIEMHGAVSEPTAIAMAEGAQVQAGVNIAISITGIAGPSGGSIEKPIGTVCFGWAIRGDSGNRVLSKTMHFTGDRQSVREQARDFVLSELLRLLKN